MNTDPPIADTVGVVAHEDLGELAAVLADDEVPLLHTQRDSQILEILGRIGGCEGGQVDALVDEPIVTLLDRVETYRPSLRGGFVDLGGERPERRSMSTTRRARKSSGTGRPGCGAVERRGPDVGGVAAVSGRFRGMLAEAMDQPHLIEAMDGVLRRLGGTADRWRVDRMAMVINPDSGRVQASFAPVAKHYGVIVVPCPPRRGNLGTGRPWRRRCWPVR